MVVVYVPCRTNTCFCYSGCYKILLQVRLTFACSYLKYLKLNLIKAGLLIKLVSIRGCKINNCYKDQCTYFISYFIIYNFSLDYVY